MPKRFIDTELFRKKFFRTLEAPYKLLFIYLFLDCNHAGIWIVDFDLVNFYLKDIDEKKAYEYLGNKIYQIDNGEKWFIPSFIDFQYGELNSKNRAHNSVINILKKEKLWEDNKILTSPLEGVKDKDKDKDMDKDKVKDTVKDKEPKYNRYSFLKSLLKEKYPELEDLIKEHMIIRDKQKCSNTERSMNGYHNQLIKHSGGDVEKMKSIIGNSCDNGWKGLFELKDQRDDNARGKIYTEDEIRQAGNYGN
jgi:hypothetical protein